MLSIELYFKCEASERSLTFTANVAYIVRGRGIVGQLFC